jgi:two-component system NtrC family sensor kinase
MLLLRDLEPGARKQVETIYQEAERASKIVSNLLTFARRRKPTKEPANLNALIERVLELRNYDLRVRNIDVEMQLDASLPETMVDTNQIQQVFLNVVINAEQAMRSEGGHGRFVIRSGVVEGNVRITFQDSGPGMSAETVRRVFDPFFTTKDAGEGTGLGLTISYGIIEEHGGRIWAESEPGRGTAFHVDLPVLAGVSSVPTELRREPERVTENADRHRILIVDDEDSIQKLLTGVLEMDGHQVSVASNGREALEQLMRDSFDLIITDIKMPVMSGTDLYRRLSDDGSPLARRLIFVTGDTVAPETRKFLETVDNAVLSKPFRLRDVRETVRATLSK